MTHHAPAGGSVQSPGAKLANNQSVSTTANVGLRHAVSAFMADDPLTLAASIAFYSALSFAPLVVLSLGIGAELWPGSEKGMVEQLGALLGPQVRAVAEMIVENGRGERFTLSVSGLVSMAALFVSASTAFAQLQDAINRIWMVEAPKSTGAVWGWIRRRLLSLGMIAVIGFFLVMTLVVSTFLASALIRDGWAWMVFNELVTVAVFTTAFFALFRYVPDEREPWRATLIGAFLTAVLFDAGKWLLGAYLASSGSADAYGTSGSVVLLLVWVYYSSLIVLVGAALTKWFGDRAGERVAG